MSIGAARPAAQGAADVKPPLIDNTLDTLLRCLNMASTSAGPDVVEEHSEWQHDQHVLSDDVADPIATTPDRANAIKIVEYKDESQIGDIMRLITKDLSEPYSIYTYRYFIHNWPELCLLAVDSATDQCVGVVVCKIDCSPRHNKQRGYIAMLAVDEGYRRMGIGTRLVGRCVNLMADRKCDEVMLETEVNNCDAMRLYTNLGFIREKRLFRYYLNGVDAFRLKLYFSPPDNGDLGRQWAMQEAA